jgi:hypothetical protein
LKLVIFAPTLQKNTMIHDPHGPRRFNITFDLAGDPNHSDWPFGRNGRVPFNDSGQNSDVKPELPGNQNSPFASQHMEPTRRNSAFRTKLPNNKMATLAMLLTGFTDPKLIADSTGLPVSEVQELKRAKDPRVQRIINDGLPAGDLYRLRNPVKCPNCGGRIYLVPCILCR